jgi:hypothetical protein
VLADIARPRRKQESAGKWVRPVHELARRSEKPKQTRHSLSGSNFYEDKNGQVIEHEISIPQSRARFTTALFLGLSNLWQGSSFTV